MRLPSHVAGGQSTDRGARDESRARKRAPRHGQREAAAHQGAGRAQGRGRFPTVRREAALPAGISDGGPTFRHLGPTLLRSRGAR